ncbi:hypothetical protein ScPMuIL_015748 [Solemya velum]
MPTIAIETTIESGSNDPGQTDMGHSCNSIDEPVTAESPFVSWTVESMEKTIHTFYQKNCNIMWGVIYVILLATYFAYFGYALYWRVGDEGSVRLIVCTVVGALFVTYRLVVKYGQCPNLELFSKNRQQRENLLNWIHVAAAISVTLAVFIYVIITVAINTPRNMVSLGGMVFFILTFYIFSTHPSKVKIRPVFWGLAIQFVFALVILRWEVGFRVFSWLGDRVSELLSYSNAGAQFVFGDQFAHHFFAFKVLSVVMYFSAAIAILYHIGVMQFIVRNIARFMAGVLGTSAAESLNAAVNIFLGPNGAALMIEPFLADMTKSELHAVMTGGFATIAGGVMAAYILIGVSANHLLSASVMSAPAALAMSKLFYPETERHESNEEDVYRYEKSDSDNVLDVATRGAAMSVKVATSTAANLIAFISLLAFVNATLQWFGERVGLENPPLTFQLMCSYVFWPLAYLMGVDRQDCFKVGELIGIKTFINEFVAYTDLSVYIDNVKNITWYKGLRNSTNLTRGFESQMHAGKLEIQDDSVFLYDLNITLEKGIMTDRSIVISTYALCGFSNIGSMGIMLGTLGALAPSRKGDLATVVLRAMIAGNVACFMTACIAVPPTHRVQPIVDVLYDFL